MRGSCLSREKMLRNSKCGNSWRTNGFNSCKTMPSIFKETCYLTSGAQSALWCHHANIINRRRILLMMRATWSLLPISKLTWAPRSDKGSWWQLESKHSLWCTTPIPTWVQNKCWLIVMTCFWLMILVCRDWTSTWISAALIFDETITHSWLTRAVVVSIPYHRTINHQFTSVKEVCKVWEMADPCSPKMDLP